jgi:hypothetical protein
MAAQGGIGPFNTLNKDTSDIVKVTNAATLAHRRDIGHNYIIDHEKAVQILRIKNKKKKESRPIEQPKFPSLKKGIMFEKIYDENYFEEK